MEKNSHKSQKIPNLETLTEPATKNLNLAPLHELLINDLPKRKRKTKTMVLLKKLTWKSENT